MASLLKNLANPFDATKPYKFGDRFLYGGHMYQVLESFSGEIDMTKVSEVTIADLVKGGYPPCNNYAGVSLQASAVTSDDSNTYFGVPKAGYYNEDSKIFAENSNLAIDGFTVSYSSYADTPSNTFTCNVGDIILAMIVKQVGTTVANIDVTSGATVLKSAVQCAQGSKAILVKATDTTVKFSYSNVDYASQIVCFNLSQT